MNSTINTRKGTSVVDIFVVGVVGIFVGVDGLGVVIGFGVIDIGIVVVLKQWIKIKNCWKKSNKLPSHFQDILTLICENPAFSKKS